MWLDSKAVNCPQKWGNFSLIGWFAFVVITLMLSGGRIA